MKKKTIIILLAATLFLGETVSLLVAEGTTSQEGSKEDHESVNTPSDSPHTLCGGGNGGGDPG